MTIKVNGCSLIFKCFLASFVLNFFLIFLRKVKTLFTMNCTDSLFYFLARQKVVLFNWYKYLCRFYLKLTTYTQRQKKSRTVNLIQLLPSLARGFPECYSIRFNFNFGSPRHCFLHSLYNFGSVSC